MAALLTRLTGRGGRLRPVRLPQLLPTYAIRLLNSFTLADSLGFKDLGAYRFSTSTRLERTLEPDSEDQSDVLFVKKGLRLLTRSESRGA